MNLKQNGVEMSPLSTKYCLQ